MKNKTTNKDSKITNEKPVSLYPLGFKEAVAALLKVKPKERESNEKKDEGRADEKPDKGQE